MKHWLYIFICIILFTSCKDKGQLIYTVPDTNDSYNFPYFLYLPEDLAPDKELVLIVEPNNSGFISDSLEKHIEKARGQATSDFYIGNFVARELQYPLLVPVFPRPESDWEIYTHALDRDAINQENNDLERIDLQLLAMVREAQAILTGMGFNVNKKILMTGFSASGTFVNRFTLIHPEKVMASAAGGLNGLLMLPRENLFGEPLPYPIGVDDYENLFGKPFDAEAFQQLPQFLFMGAQDENDAVPYDDGYAPFERRIIYQVLGMQMQPIRWSSCINVYMQDRVNANILTYSKIGHEHPEKVKNDIVVFFTNVVK